MWKCLQKSCLAQVFVVHDMIDWLAVYMVVVSTWFHWLMSQSPLRFWASWASETPAPKGDERLTVWCNVYDVKKGHKRPACSVWVCDFIERIKLSSRLTIMSYSHCRIWQRIGCCAAQILLYGLFVCAVCDLSVVPLCQVFMSLDSAWTGAQPVEVSRVNLHVMDWSLPQINV